MAATETRTARDDAGLLARLDRLPVWALPRRYLVIIGLGYFFTFYDISDIGFAMPAINKQFHLGSSESTFVALSIGLIGYAVGSIVIGFLADRLGRYKLLVATILLTAVGSFGDAAANGVVMLTVFRFITGAGVGADLNLVSTYLGELSPAGRRGRITVLTFLVGIIGQAVTPFVALGLVPNLTIGWRLLFAIGGVIATIGLVARFQLPESPRWLVHHGRGAEAADLVTEMEASVRRRGIELPEPTPEQPTAAVQRAPLLDLLRQPYLGRLAVFVPLWFFWYIGNYGFLGDATTLLTKHGASIGSSTLFLAIGAIGYPVGALAMIVLADRVERRLLIVGSAATWLAGMILVGVRGDGPVIAGSFLAAFALGLYLQVAYTFTAESFPTRARATGFALSDGIGHGGGAVGGLLLPVMVTDLGFFTGFLIIGLTGLFAGVLSLAGPRASRRRLEHISA